MGVDGEAAPQFPDQRCLADAVLQLHADLLKQL
jgi:hypothetical protein